MIVPSGLEVAEGDPRSRSMADRLQSLGTRVGGADPLLSLLELVLLHERAPQDELGRRDLVQVILTVGPERQRVARQLLRQLPVAEMQVHRGQGAFRLR